MRGRSAERRQGFREVRRGAACSEVVVKVVGIKGATGSSRAGWQITLRHQCSRFVVATRTTKLDMLPTDV